VRSLAALLVPFRQIRPLPFPFIQVMNQLNPPSWQRLVRDMVDKYVQRLAEAPQNCVLTFLHVPSLAPSAALPLAQCLPLFAENVAIPATIAASCGTTT
jgi:hypothetical protein